jgi:EAL domain-containing protein (putative c-di-GMP-specific phosphodiesterase class I)
VLEIGFWGNEMADVVKVGPVPRDELRLLFQPQMSSDGNTIVSVEALIRREHPTRGRISAFELLKLYNTVALREELDWWVLEEAAKQSLRWPQLSVSVNINATQFRHKDFAERVLAVLASLNVSASRIELEILEATFISDFDAAIENINLLRSNGVKIALDDFGTGYSSLTYLLRIPIDKLKIDKSFIDKVDSIQAAAVTQALVAMSRALGIKVTAEGVETTAQHQFLKAVGCHYLQGYLFSPPTSPDAIDRMLADNRTIDIGPTTKTQSVPRLSAVG